MSQRKIRALTIKRKTNLSTHWIRFTLTGASLADFPEGFEGGYIKVLLKPENAADDFDFESPETGKPIMRSYTICGFDKAAKEIDIDFAYHGLTGPAAHWANSTKEGDQVYIVGPGPVKLSNPQADFFVMVGDMPALPAIRANIQQLPADAKGTVFVEATSEQDQVQFDAPKDLDIQWIINPTPAQANDGLIQALQKLDWPDGHVEVWSATEFNTMKTLRKFFRQEKQIDKDRIYISSYWKIGDTDEQHKKAKKLDSEKDL